jgi:hypothetical protein
VGDIDFAFADEPGDAFEVMRGDLKAVDIEVNLGEGIGESEGPEDGAFGGFVVAALLFVGGCAAAADAMLEVTAGQVEQSGLGGVAEAVVLAVGGRLGAADVFAEIPVDLGGAVGVEVITDERPGIVQAEAFLQGPPVVAVLHAIGTEVIVRRERHGIFRLLDDHFIGHGTCPSEDYERKGQRSPTGLCDAERANWWKAGWHELLTAEGAENAEG